MNRKQSQRYGMLVKVREFGNKHREKFPDTSPAAKAFAAVAAVVTEVAAHGSVMLVRQKEGQQRKAAVREEILERLNGIARTARIVARSAPDAGEVLLLEVPKTDAGLVMAVQGLVKGGQAAVAPLVPLGVSGTVVAELQALAGRFEQVDRGDRTGRAVRAAATNRLAEAFEPATEPLRLLDVVVANTFAHDAAELAAWKRARHVPSPRVRHASPVVTPPATTTEAEPGATPAEASTEGMASPPASGDTLRRAS